LTRRQILFANILEKLGNVHEADFKMQDEMTYLILRNEFYMNIKYVKLKKRLEVRKSLASMIK